MLQKYIDQKEIIKNEIIMSKIGSEYSKIQIEKLLTAKLKNFKYWINNDLFCTNENDFFEIIVTLSFDELNKLVFYYDTNKLTIYKYIYRYLQNLNLFEYLYSILSDKIDIEKVFHENNKLFLIYNNETNTSDINYEWFLQNNIINYKLMEDLIYNLIDYGNYAKLNKYYEDNLDKLKLLIKNGYNINSKQIKISSDSIKNNLYYFYNCATKYCPLFSLISLDYKLQLKPENIKIIKQYIEYFKNRNNLLKKYINYKPKTFLPIIPDYIDTNINTNIDPNNIFTPCDLSINTRTEMIKYIERKLTKLYELNDNKKTKKLIEFFILQLCSLDIIPTEHEYKIKLFTFKIDLKNKKIEINHANPNYSCICDNFESQICTYDFDKIMEIISILKK